MLRMEFLCFQKCSHNYFPPTPPMLIQDTYINNKPMASTLCTDIRRWERVSQFVNLKEPVIFFLHLVLQVETTKPENYYNYHVCIGKTLALQWSNHLYYFKSQQHFICGMYKKRMMEWTKADSNVVMVAMWLRINKLKHAGVILHPYHVILFLKTSQNLLFVIGFP